MSESWTKSSAAFVAGSLVTVTFFVTAAYVVVKALRTSTGAAGPKMSDKAITAVILVLLCAAAFFVFHRRKTAEPPKWMGALQTATPKLSFKLGLLLLGVFPTDILTSTAVGFHLAREGAPWYYCLTFVLVTVFLIALPGLLVLVMGQRAVQAHPAVREWMNANPWIVSEAVIALFVGLQVNTLVSS
jgi:Sap, sulfolipid-1-addressing protein